MIEVPASDSQQRLEAILADPEDYFARAHIDASAEASAEVGNELAARAYDRRNGRDHDVHPSQHTD